MNRLAAAYAAGAQAALAVLEKDAGLMTGIANTIGKGVKGFNNVFRGGAAGAATREAAAATQQGAQNSLLAARQRALSSPGTQKFMADVAAKRAAPPANIGYKPNQAFNSSSGWGRA